MQVLPQLTLEVQRIVDRVVVDVWIELVDLGLANAELAGHDPQARTWPLEVRSA
jgi:hypothetical protein